MEIARIILTVLIEIALLLVLLLIFTVVEFWLVMGILARFSTAQIFIFFSCVIAIMTILTILYYASPNTTKIISKTKFSRFSKE